ARDRPVARPDHPRTAARTALGRLAAGDRHRPEPLRRRRPAPRAPRPAGRQVIAPGRSRYGAADLLAVPGVRQDGTTVSVEFTIHPVRDAGGQLVGLAATLRALPH